MVPEEKTIGHRLECAGMLRSRNYRHVRSRAERNDYVIELQLACIAFSDTDTNGATLDIDLLYSAFDEVHVSKTRANGLRTMTQLEHTRAGLEEEWTQQEKIVAADECHFDIVPAANQSIEMARRGKPANSSAKDDDLLSALDHGRRRPLNLHHEKYSYLIRFSSNT
jgi:hypothetical protein